MSDGLQVEIVGIDKLVSNLDKFGKEIGKGMSDAGVKIGSMIVRQPGLKQYPAAGSQNSPGRTTSTGRPMGWYVRGRGWHSPTTQYYTSERLGTQWTVEPSTYQVTISNKASYAPYVHGEEQSRLMELYGWRKLVDVAREQLSEAARIYQAFVDRLIKRLGL